MADAPTVRSRRITRDKLASFLPSHELIKAFEDLIEDVIVSLPDAVAADADDMDTVLKASAFARQSSPTPPTNDDAAPLMAAQLFARQAPTPQADPDTASAILATQIFGA